MAWTLYRITWRLESPLHSGFARLGNIQRTRLYVTGRMLWGAMTARLTRDQGRSDYVKVGCEVNKCLHFSYGYLCFTEDGSLPLLPEYTAKGLRFNLGDKSMNKSLNEREAQRLCLTSYASTALDYSNNAAVDGSLHEVEFISPLSLCEMNDLSIKAGQPLCLTAFIAESDETAANEAVRDWKESLDRLRVGGERNYGFGKLSLKSRTDAGSDWWGIEFVRENAQVKIKSDQRLLAHTEAVASLFAETIKHGSLEPLVGRDTTPQGAFGQNVRHVGVCWQPGTKIEKAITCQIKPMGIWQAIT